jgi:thymidylate synthase ThyX
MRVKSVGISPTSQQDIALVPELLASVGARYSRNNEGLEAILEKVAGMDQDKAVDSIFKMLDYGHKSIGDMSPSIMFMDNISIWLALHIWHLCPTAGGQESSTRYIKLSIDNVTRPEYVDKSPAIDFDKFVKDAFGAYEKALDLWSEYAELNPESSRIPQHLLDSTDKKDKLAVDRLKRNFAFDRARYYIPMCCQTNVMMVMSARAWVDLIKQLLSDSRIEAKRLGESLASELNKVTPRLTKHAVFDPEFAKGISRDFNGGYSYDEQFRDVSAFQDSGAFIDVQEPRYLKKWSISEGLKSHNNRYGHFGKDIKRISIRFGWEALTIAELRDLNRHRTGNKYFTLEPVGLYCADDEIDRLHNQITSTPGSKSAEVVDRSIAILSDLRSLKESAASMNKIAKHMYDVGHQDFVYFLPMGAQCYFEHVTTANHFLYECELRTGLGAHYTYAARMREVLELWHQRYPETRSMIVPGTAEPE